MHIFQVKRYKIQIALSICLVLWATAFTAIRAALTDFTPAHLAFIRCLFSSLLLIPVALARGLKLPPWRDVRMFLWAGSAGIGIYQLTLGMGEQSITAASASFIVNTGPVYTALFASVFLKERINRAGWLGILISFAGATLISFGESGKLNLNQGAFWVLISAFSNSLFIISAKPLLQRYSSIEATCYFIWAGTLFLIPFSKGWSSDLFTASTHTILAILYLALLPGIAAYLLWSYVLSHWSATVTGATLLIVPFLSVLAGILWLHESPAGISLTGGILSLTGVLILLRYR